MEILPAVLSKAGRELVGVRGSLSTFLQVSARPFVCAMAADAADEDGQEDRSILTLGRGSAGICRS